MKASGRHGEIFTDDEDYEKGRGWGINWRSGKRSEININPEETAEDGSTLMLMITMALLLIGACFYCIQNNYSIQLVKLRPNDDTKPNTSAEDLMLLTSLQKVLKAINGVAAIQMQHERELISHMKATVPENTGYGDRNLVIEFRTSAKGNFEELERACNNANPDGDNQSELLKIRNETIAKRSKAIARTYKARQDEFRAWCEKMEFPKASLYTVNEDKMLRFLQDRVIDRPCRKKGKKRSLEGYDSDEDVVEEEEKEGASDAGGHKTVGFKTVEGYISAIKDLYHHQLAHDENPNGDPCGKAIKELMKSQRRRRPELARANPDDRGIGTFQDGYTAVLEMVRATNRRLDENAHMVESLRRDLTSGIAGIGNRLDSLERESIALSRFVGHLASSFRDAGILSVVPPLVTQPTPFHTLPTRVAMTGEAMEPPFGDADRNYMFNQQIETVSEVFKEWTEGLVGPDNVLGPSIVSLDRRFGTSWRLDNARKNYHSRNNRLVTAIQSYMAQHKVSQEDAVNHHERLLINSGQTLRVYIRNLPSAKKTRISPGNL